MPFPKKKKQGKTGFIFVLKQPFRYHRKYSIILVLVCMQTHSWIDPDQCLICESQMHNSGRKHKFYSFTGICEHCRHIGLLSRRLLGRLQLLARGEAVFVIRQSFLILISGCLLFISELRGHSRFKFRLLTWKFPLTQERTIND